MSAINKCINTIVGVVLLTLLPTIGLFDVWPESIPFNLSSKASASTQSGYVPPVGRKPIERTDGSGSRGCPKGSFGSISLLVPSDHIGLTLSAHPTFSWYVSAAPSTPMQFALVEPGVSKPLLVKNLKASGLGIMQMDLPANMPELVVGKEYRWTVSLVCNVKRPSQNIYVRSWIQRESATAVEMPLTGSIRDLSMGSLRERAMFYAQSGIWYDAVAAMSKAYFANPEDPLNVQYLSLLLNQVGLTQVATAQLQQ